ncbi:hypothetical protein [Stieleria mannarensis]|uniref:hypothetical protein n=1 Tax=Stieleria mannarensis TaxID=2755585 RepID=UPI0016001E2F|nr:hypothetical protein [Rhodopirellula sp. JC639]
MERLAHRGLWTEPREKNRRVAFERAFAAGFGVETDLRDHNGTVVISHDPPGGATQPELTFEEFLALYQNCQATGTLALNVKADGLSAIVDQLLKKYNLDRYFVFDMAIPDMLAYSKLKMRCFSRQSEFESPTLLKNTSSTSPIKGIWLDSFSTIWYSTALVREHLASGLDVCLVSPELHGRDPQPWWDELRTFLQTTPPDHDPQPGRLMLCTDFPHEF